jgi:hypothetical protein
MRTLVSRVLAILAQLGAVLASCVGCSSKSIPDSEHPRTIRWQGHESGYQGTTLVPPSEDAGTINQEQNHARRIP